MIISGNGKRNMFLSSRTRSPTKAGSRKEEKNNWKDGSRDHAGFAGLLDYAGCMGMGAGLHSQPGLAPHRGDGLSRDTWRAAGSPGSPPSSCEACRLSQTEDTREDTHSWEFSFAQLLYHLAQKELMNAVVACEFIFLRWNRYVFGKDFALRLFTGEHLCPAGQMVDEVTAASSRRKRPLLPSSDEKENGAERRRNANNNDDNKKEEILKKPFCLFVLIFYSAKPGHPKGIHGNEAHSSSRRQKQIPS